MIRRLICRLFGHKRGKLRGIVAGYRNIYCPRCGAEWSRRVRHEQQSSTV